MHIDSTIASLKAQQIDKRRKLMLQPLIDYIKSGLVANKPIRLNFICTHNSRRSQMAQVWSFVLAEYFKIPIQSYSGGVEITDFFSAAIECLEDLGVIIEKENGPQPQYKVLYNNHQLLCFSKLFDGLSNPIKNFAAILTCSDADNNCPIIDGAEKRIALPYNDPKVFDNSKLKKEKYKACTLQIASELYYVFSTCKKWSLTPK